MSDSPRTSQPETLVQSEKISLAELFKIVWNRRWLVLWITLGFAVAGAIAAFVWPKTYEATATVYPVTSNSSGGLLSQYAGLASMAGISLPDASSGNDPTQMVNALLASRLLVEAVVKDLDLVPKLRAPGFVPPKDYTADDEFNDTVKSVEQSIKTKQDKDTGVISVTVALRDPELAQVVTNRLLELLDDLLGEKSLTTTKKKIEQLNNQIDSQKRKVDQYQRQMADFQKQTSLLDPKAQSTSAFDAFSLLIQQRMALEVQLATARASYTADNPKVVVLQNQLDSMEKQIQTVKNQVGGDLPSMKSAPEDLIRYQNLATDLEVATKIYAGLLASLEQAKLSDDKDQVYVEILDRALIPKEGKPSRSLIVLLVVFMGFFIGVVVALFRSPFSRILLRQMTSPQE